MTIKVMATVEFKDNLPIDMRPWLLSHIISTKLNENLETITWLEPWMKYVRSVDVRKEEA